MSTCSVCGDPISPRFLRCAKHRYMPELAMNVAPAITVRPAPLPPQLPPPVRQPPAPPPPPKPINDERKAVRSNVRRPMSNPDAPRTRLDCLPGGSNESRPCPWVSCVHHLGVDHRFDAGGKPTGGISVLDGIEDGDLEGMKSSCSLDVADRGGHTLEDVSEYFGGITRERVRQIEAKAVRRLKRSGAKLRVFHDPDQ